MFKIPQNQLNLLSDIKRKYWNIASLFKVLMGGDICGWYAMERLRYLFY